MKLPVKKLIDIAKSEPLPIVGVLADDEFKDTLDEAQKFILAFKVKEGKNKVMAATIFEAYERWSLNPITKISFFIYFARVFPKNKAIDSTYYLINYKPLALIKKAEEIRDKSQDG